MHNNQVFSRIQYEWGTMLFFLLSSFLLYIGYFNYFTVPLSDFFAFEDNASAYLNFELPSSLKRQPAYPLIIGIFTLSFQSSTLFAAEVISLFCSILNALLVYRISLLLLGEAGFVVALLFAVNPTTVWLAAQPILETFLLSTILSTIFLCIKESNWKYLAAFLASMVRYEAALLIPILFLQDYLVRKKRLQAVALGLLSSSGIVVWTTLIIKQYSSLGAHPYAQQFYSLGLGESRFLANSVQSIVEFMPRSTAGGIPFIVLVATSTVLLFTGLITFLKQEHNRIHPVIYFAGSYFLIHLLYPSVNAPLRYVWPILWAFYLFIVRGGQIIGGEVVHKIRNMVTPRLLQALWGSLVFVIVLINAFIIVRMYEEGGFFLYVSYTTFLLTAIIYALSRVRSVGRSQVGLVVGLFLLLSTFVGASLVTANREMERNSWKYYRVQQRKVGEWYGVVAKPGDRLAALRPDVMRYYSGLTTQYFVNLQDFQSETASEFLSELRRRNITYIVWDSQHARGKENKLGLQPLPFLFDPEVISHLEVIREIDEKRNRAIIFRVKLN